MARQLKYIARTQGAARTKQSPEEAKLILDRLLVRVDAAARECAASVSAKKAGRPSNAG